MTAERRQTDRRTADRRAADRRAPDPIEEARIARRLAEYVGAPA